MQKKFCQLAGTTLLRDRKCVTSMLRRTAFQSSQDAAPVSIEERYVAKVELRSTYLMVTV